MTKGASITSDCYKDGTGTIAFETQNGNGFDTNLEVLPTGQVVLGAQRDQILLNINDGLVLGSPMRLVPTESSLPACNEVRRGWLVVQDEIQTCEIGYGDCHSDVLKLCLKNQEYEWVTVA